MKIMRKICAVMMAAAMTAALHVPAFAVVNYDVIDTVSLNIDSYIEAGESYGEVSVRTNTTGCEVSRVSITNEPTEDWDEGDRPKVTIVLEVTDAADYRFDTAWKKTDVELDIEGAVVSSVSDSSSGRKLTVKVTLPKLEYDEGFLATALEIEDAQWDESNGVAMWEENTYAKRYEVKIYRNGSSVGGTLRTTDNEYDLSKYFTKKGDYYFKVRAIRSTNVAGSWYESEEIYVDSDEAEDIRENGGSSSSSSSSSASGAGGPGTSRPDGAWLKDNIGWWWCNADRTYPASAWKYINNKWYYFNASGYCVQNGWIQTNNIWYYCGPDGDMWTNRWTPDGYYVNNDGAWVH